jgi:hypothetical protein
MSEVNAEYGVDFAGKRVDNVTACGQLPLHSLKAYKVLLAEFKTEEVGLIPSIGTVAVTTCDAAGKLPKRMSGTQARTTKRTVHRICNLLQGR